MNPDLISALWILLIGMGLLFIALLLLWGIMSLMVSLTARQAEKEAAQKTAEGLPRPATAAPGEEPIRLRSQAAAAAVAVALALKTKSNGHGQFRPLEEPFSAWQSVQRANRLSQKSRYYTRKPRRSEQ